MAGTLARGRFRVLCRDSQAARAWPTDSTQRVGTECARDEQEPAGRIGLTYCVGPWLGAGGGMRKEQARARVVTLLALAAIYVAAGKLGLSMAVLHESASAVWPPTGIALGAFLLLGRSAWPAIFAGAFLVNVTTAGSPATSLAIAAG